MAVLLLPGDVAVQIDDEDHAWASLRSWRLWRKAQSERWIAVCDEAAKGRRYRVRLHREVAIRMRPDLKAVFHRIVVRPRNGDHLDVRRENLEVVVRQTGAAGDARPAGYRYLARPGRPPRLRNHQLGRSQCWKGGRCGG